MKTVFKKIGRVLYEAIRMIITTAVLACLAVVLTVGLMLLPVLGIAQSICHGGSPWNNTCDFFEVWKEKLKNAI